MAETSLIKAGALKKGMDSSEDWLINCRQDGARVCDGAHIDVYAEYMVKNGGLIHENSSPYKSYYGPFQKPETCLTQPYWSPGYKFEKAVVEWGENGNTAGSKGPTDEQIMMQVMEHGSSAIGIYTGNPVFSYKSGVLDTCRNDRPIKHAVLV